MTLSAHNAQPRPVLVVDDEPDVRAVIGAGLAGAGWTAIEVATGVDAIAIATAGTPAAVILDINLTGESGYDVCRAIRAVSDVPILFLTARQDEFDHVLGLELGADDFMTKPISPRLLAARVAAAVRRSSQPDAHAVLRAGQLELDPVSRRVAVDGRDLSLSKTEFDLLAVLLSEPRRAFDRNTLLDRVWGEWYSDSHVVDVTMGRLRRKLAEAGADGVIETLRGVGYRVSTATAA